MVTTLTEGRKETLNLQIKRYGAIEATTSRKPKAGEDGDKGSTASRGRNPTIGRLSPKRSDKQNSTLSP